MNFDNYICDMQIYFLLCVCVCCCDKCVYMQAVKTWVICYMKCHKSIPSETCNVSKIPILWVSLISQVYAKHLLSILIFSLDDSIALLIWIKYLHLCEFFSLLSKQIHVHTMAVNGNDYLQICVVAAKHIISAMMIHLSVNSIIYIEQR